MTRGTRNGPARQQPVVAGGEHRTGPAALTPRPCHPALADPPGDGDEPGDEEAPETSAPPRPTALPSPPSPPSSGTDGATDTGTDPGAGAGIGDAEALRARLAERTADLQRVKAEYDNYRKRVRRDHLTVRQIAVANVLAGLLPVLDAVDAAHAQGEAAAGLGQITALLEERLAALGLEPVGEPGDAFDPNLHEAVGHTSTDGVTRPTCAAVHRRGYRVGRQLLRPAEVTVAEPKAKPPAAPG